MTTKLIQQGAEAKILLNEKEGIITKDRISKAYRIKELDDKIRKQRTKSETKLLEKASKIINSPTPLSKTNIYQIPMHYINGKKLSESLNDFPLEKQKQIMHLIGENIAKLHKEDIIHGDLTTSNMILVEEDKLQLFFIDFGLGFISKKTEDKAVDLHLLKQALEAKHFQNWQALFKEFEKAYETELGSTEAKKVFERIISVERRGRYRH
jgi:TP53 regulating kinase and related kinases